MRRLSRTLPPAAASFRAYVAHYNDSRENGPFGLLPAQLSYRASFRRDSTAN